MKLPVIHFRKSPVQTVEKQPFSKIGQFHRLGQTLRRRHPPEHVEVAMPVRN